jgi:hypothetical protein
MIAAFTTATIVSWVGAVTAWTGHEVGQGHTLFGACVCLGLTAVSIFICTWVGCLLVSGPTHPPFYKLFGLHKPHAVVKGYVAPGYEKVRAHHVFQLWKCVNNTAFVGVGNIYQDHGKWIRGMYPNLRIRQWYLCGGPVRGQRLQANNLAWKGVGESYEWWHRGEAF